MSQATEDIGGPDWCVRHKYGWCLIRAIRRADTPPVNNVPTACEVFVISPLEVERREPTCAACIGVLHHRARSRRSIQRKLDSHGP